MKVFAVLALLLAAAVGTNTLGSHDLLVFIVGWFVGLPVALTLIIWFLVCMTVGGGASARLKKASLIFIIISGSIAASLYLGKLAGLIYLNQARAYVERVIPMLDAYQQKHGSYPTDLDDVAPEASPPPRLLQSPSAYTSTADQFRFSFSVPAERRDHIFDSESRSWDYKK